DEGADAIGVLDPACGFDAGADIDDAWGKARDGGGHVVRVEAAGDDQGETARNAAPDRRDGVPGAARAGPAGAGAGGAAAPVEEDPVAHGGVKGDRLEEIGRRTGTHDLPDLEAARAPEVGDELGRLAPVELHDVEA